jgi:trans-2-enoyl-CoA reductase
VAKKPSRNDALEAIDFIINVLREHEKDLDRLIGELSKITEQFSDTGEVSEKIDRIEERLSNMQTEVANLISFMSGPRPEIPSTPAHIAGAPVIVKCKNWQDFKVLAQNAETVSYTLQDTEKTFQADALKQGRILTCSGDLPKNSKLLKTWLSKELDIREDQILEGLLTLR